MRSEFNCIVETEPGGLGIEEKLNGTESSPNAK